MPEGDTIHTLASLLAPALQGRCLDRVSIRHRPQVALAGQRVERVTSKGKHLYIELTNGLTIRSHLGLYGSWHGYSQGETWRKPPRQAGLILDLSDRVYVCFNPREVEILATTGFRAADQRNRLGPDLTRETPDVARIARDAQDRLPPDTLAVDLLLDQRIASGIGNVYKSEVLFLESCSPAARLSELSEERLIGLYTAARRLLLANLDGGPRTTRTEPDGRGRLWVYRRAGLACLRCGRPIVRALLGRNPRSTYWCPVCQDSARDPDSEPVDGARRA